MILLAEKNNHLLISTVNKWSDESIKIQQMLKTILVEFNQYIKDVQLHLAYARVWHFINMINSYFHSQEPWKVAKKDTALFNEILSTTAHALYAVAILCWPLMPKIMEKLLTSLGHKLICECDMFQTLATDDWLKTFSLSSQGTLFVKPIIEKNVAVEENNKEVPANQSTEISIEQFRQCELRAGTVIHCEPLPNADKLLQLTVSFGAYGERQILSGIKKWYTPEQLIGKQFVFLYNLKARAMVGINSHGMILCASNTDGMPIPIGTVNQVPDGSLLG
jgi:methionyl-tRNA synthetase